MTVHLISNTKIYRDILWIVIYLIDNVIHPFYNTVNWWTRAKWETSTLLSLDFGFQLRSDLVLIFFPGMLLLLFLFQFLFHCFAHVLVVV